MTPLGIRARLTGALVAGALLLPATSTAQTMEQAQAELQAVFQALNYRSFAASRVATACPADFSSAQVAALQRQQTVVTGGFLARAAAAWKLAYPKAGNAELQALTDEQYEQLAQHSAAQGLAEWRVQGEALWPAFTAADCGGGPLQEHLTNALDLARLSMYEVFLGQARYADGPCVAGDVKAAVAAAMATEMAAIAAAYPAAAQQARQAVSGNPASCGVFEMADENTPARPVMSAFAHDVGTVSRGRGILNPLGASEVFGPLYARRIPADGSLPHTPDLVAVGFLAVGDERGAPTFRNFGGEMMRVGYSVTVLGDGRVALQFQTDRPFDFTSAGMDIRGGSPVSSQAIEALEGDTPERRVVRVVFPAEKGREIRERLRASTADDTSLWIQDGKTTYRPERQLFDPAAFLKLWDWAAATGRNGEPSIR